MKKDSYVRCWLWTGAGLIFLMVVVGGITRLTGSGLSMSDWSLIMGAWPPISESEWMAVFERYKEFPQYQQLNRGMSLSEFKGIFFWEYLHRLLGRIIGIVFLVPFIFFWVRGYFDSNMLRRAWILFALGALQGGMGWIMVKSGLVDAPYVSHHRLALHLLLAMILFGFCIWYVLDLYDSGPPEKSNPPTVLKWWSLALLVLFIAQVVWGAFTAGLDAGYIYNTFPTMNGDWLPRSAWALKPAVLNLVKNPGTVQWVHRILGTLLAVAALIFWWKHRNAGLSPIIEQKARMLLGMVLTQYVLGILTVITHVDIITGVVHQAGALMVLFFWIWYYHDLIPNEEKG
ncbi:cytochrome c oxidase assembly protein subunit 15 [Fodinibius roseus]|uniref:Cytochrome c oxidase assembly protein subunit 15 n=1 Tax=Fodinibius roseus TaxID=1194090 RepID=A0A1M5ELB9_9BACT|nr:COX15/CtaA family protein [Fodinibius roseus]SHF79920.1 cytochrome c oxidase assembly protein subunit 15 [Fodinibius roseus]